MSNNVECVTRDGHDIFVGANRFTGKDALPGYYFVVTLQFQEQPGVIGYAVRAGMILPKEGSQTGEWTEALLGHLYTTLPTWWEGRPANARPSGFPVMIHIAPSETYREEPTGPADHLVDEEPGSWDDEG